MYSLDMSVAFMEFCKHDSGKYMSPQRFTILEMSAPGGLRFAKRSIAEHRINSQDPFYAQVVGTRSR